MQDKIIIKYSLKNAILYGTIVFVFLFIGVFVFFLIPRNMELTAMDYPIVKGILIGTFLIGGYITITNYFVRKLVIEKELCTYVDYVGRKKSFMIETMGKIETPNAYKMFVYDNEGRMLCKLDMHMENTMALYKIVQNNRNVQNSGKWDLLQSSLDGMNTEERLMRMCDHISNYIQYYLSEKESLGVIIEGGYFLDKHSENKEGYLYILRVKDGENYISKSLQAAWEYRIYLGFNAPEDGIIEDLTEEWMREFMNDFYAKLLSLYHKKNRKVVKQTERELTDVRTHIC